MPSLLDKSLFRFPCYTKPMTNQELHLKTKSVAVKYLQIESELVALLIEMDSRRAYTDLGYASLFQYSVSELGLSEAVTSAFITVSRKAAVVPDLMLALEEQTLTVSKAAKIVSALDIQSAPEIIEYAASHSTAQTEKWLKDKKGIETWHNLKISSKSMEKLKKVHGLIKSDLSLEEALEIALEEYIRRNDPLEKAKRSRKLKESRPKNTSYPVLAAKASGGRKPLPAALKHYIYLRDQGRCSHQVKPGLRCSHSKFLEIHHIKPISQGGSDNPQNLRLLCSAHHRMHHG